MNLADIANIRLISQQIAQTKFKTAKEIVGWMGAMQAQNYAMVKFSTNPAKRVRYFCISQVKLVRKTGKVCGESDDYLSLFQAALSTL